MAKTSDPSLQTPLGHGLSTIGKYRVLSFLGEGGMGLVYRARDPEVGRDVAIKILKTSSESDLNPEDSRKMFKLEARSLGSLKHPNIVSVFEANYQTNEPYIVMEFIEGETLSDKIKRSGKLPPHAALGYLVQIASGLDYAHSRNVLHQDIKSSNMMIDAHGQVFILDFGIAEMTHRYLSQDTDSQKNLVLGTPAALAPEQISMREIDHRSDLYALAVVAYEILSGALPYEGTTVHEVIENIRHGRRRPVSFVLKEASPELDKFFDRALAIAKGNRFNSAHELVSSLSVALGISHASNTGTQVVTDGKVKPTLVPLSSVTPESIPPAPPNDLGNPWQLETAPSKLSPITSRPGKFNRPSDFSDWSDRDRASSQSSGLSFESIVRAGGLITLLIVMPIFFYVQLNKKKVKAPPPSRPAAAPAAQAPSLDIPGENPLIDLGLEDIQIGEPNREVPLYERSDRDLIATLVSDVSSEHEVLKALEIAESKRIAQLPSAAADLLHYPSHHVRAAAADLLGRLKDRRALPYLMISLEDIDTIVRIASAKAIGALGEKKALGYLTMKYNSETVPEVRLGMKQAIEELNGFPMAE